MRDVYAQTGEVWSGQEALFGSARPHPVPVSPAETAWHQTNMPALQLVVTARARLLRGLNAAESYASDYYGMAVGYSKSVIVSWYLRVDICHI